MKYESSTSYHSQFMVDVKVVGEQTEKQTGENLIHQSGGLKKDNAFKAFSPFPQCFPKDPSMVD